MVSRSPLSERAIVLIFRGHQTEFDELGVGDPVQRDEVGAAFELGSRLKTEQSELDDKDAHRSRARGNEQPCEDAETIHAWPPSHRGKMRQSRTRGT